MFRQNFWQILIPSDANESGSFRLMTWLSRAVEGISLFSKQNLEISSDSRR